MPRPIESTVFALFERCDEAIQQAKLIRRANRQDKEFHFQNWVGARLGQTGHRYEVGGRNSYPDFRIVRCTDGYEIKGLAYPGREANYDCNSQVPSGSYNGRTIYYVFGRYPAQPDGNTYPVLDLVVCHGDFLNADHTYQHKNKSVKGFGSYGDILIRDRKMYVAPTPFGLVTGVAHTRTLILPDGVHPDDRFKEVGVLVRTETDRLIIGYSFDLLTNALTPRTVANPSAGVAHVFRAWRLASGPDEPVVLRKDAAAHADDDLEEADE